MAITMQFQMTMQTNHTQPYTRNASRVLTLTSGNGPTPGLVIATPLGTDIDLSALANPKIAFIYNMDPTSPVELGVWNADQSEFYPIGRWNPGDGFPQVLTPNLNQEYATGTGTGTTGELNTLRLKSLTASDAYVLVEAFDG